MSQKYKIIHLCNEGTPQYPGWVNVYSKRHLESEKVIDNEIIWLVNCQLIWDMNLLINDFGFEIAIYLRLVIKSKAPVILYSPVKKSYFELKSKLNKKYLLLFARGTGFLEAPFNYEELKVMMQSLLPLTNPSLHDVSTMLCNLKGIVIDRLNHDLKFSSSTEQIEDILKNVSQYLTSFQMSLVQFENFREKILNRITEKDEEGFFIIRQQFLNLCNLYLTEESEGTQIEIENKYKILLLEDNDKEMIEFCNNLEGNFEVIPCGTSEEARREILDDKANHILAVISDWRLYKGNEKLYWQDMQGYEVLEFAAKNGTRALFALTSQSDYIVHQIRNLMSIQFTLFKKENLRKKEQWQLFIDVIKESCSYVIKQRPTVLSSSAKWTQVIENKGITYKSLKQQYIDVWNSIDKSVYFIKVSDKANELVEYVNKRKHSDAPLNEQFGLSLSTKGPYELFPVLVYRRVWMALWFKEAKLGSRLSQDFISNTSQKIYKQMFSYYPSGADATVNAAQNNYKLCITPIDVHNAQVLPEEIDWLFRLGWVDNSG